MCGIIGFAGREQAAPILLDGLARMEYRGYDSAGIAVRKADTELLDQINAVVATLDREKEEAMMQEALKAQPLTLEG